MGQAQAVVREVPDAVVVLDGDGPVEPAMTLGVISGTPVLAADGGLVVALALGLRVTEVIGDLDSAPPAVVEQAEQSGVSVIRYPTDKDATDGELAVARAVARLTRDSLSRAEARHLLILGPGGGRLDQLLADVALLAGPVTEPVEVTARFGTATVLVARPNRPRVIFAPPGATVSILPIAGPAVGVTTSGLAWPLTEAVLEPGTTWGISNTVIEAGATVAAQEGTLLVVVPGPVGPIEDDDIV